MADKTGYIGRNPGDSNVIIARQTYQPTGVQTTYTFNTGYTPGYLDVYLNGTKLIRQLDFLDQTGGTVDIISPPTLGDVVEIVAYKAYSLGAPINSVAGDFSVGGNISVGGSFSITQGFSFTDLFVTGVSTLSGNLKVAGISTFESPFVRMAPGGGNSGSLKFGSGNEYQVLAGSNKLQLAVAADRSIELSHGGSGGSVFLRTTDGGINVVGGGLTVSGISTFFGNVEIGTGATIFSPSSNVLALGTNSEERLRITSNGSVIIGGTTPATVGQTQLTLRSNSQVGLALLCGAIQNSSIYMGGLNDGYSSGDSGYSDGKIMYDNSNNHMQFDTAGSERLRITSVGDININSGVTLRWGSINAAGIIGKEGSTDGYLAFAPNNTGNDSDKLRILSDGKVGIGTTNPGQKLTVYTGTPSNTGGILVQNALYGNNEDKPYLIAGTKDWTGATTNWGTFGFQHRFKSNSGGTSRITVDGVNGELFSITNGGDIGIGTANPSHKLQVGDGTVDSKNAIKLGKRVTSAQSNLPLIGHYSPDSAASGLALCATSSSGGIHFFTGNDADGFGDGNNDERARITTAGHIEIIDGNLVVADGHGVDFSATGGPINSATGVSGLLDDYERGYWTPIISNAVNQPSYTYNVVNGGWYVKVGKVVHVGFNLRATHSMATPSGTWRIDGLPYTVSAQNNGTHGNAAYSAGVISYVTGIFNLPSNSTGVGFLFMPNNDQMQVYSQRRNQISLTLDSSYMVSGTSVDLNLHGQGSYLVD